MTDAPDTHAVFGALGDETRLAILEAFIEHRRESPNDSSLSFSELRARVGVEDSGQFNYHLKKMRERFIEHTEDGYQLNYAGIAMARAILAGTYSGRERKEPETLDESCPICETAITASFDNGRVKAHCENDHTFKTELPPGAAAERSMDEMLRLAIRLTYHDLELSIEGTCPKCYGPMAPQITEDEIKGELRYLFESVCERCGTHTSSTAGGTLLPKPVVTSFYHDHGRDLHDMYLWQLPFVWEKGHVVSNEPLRLRYDIQLDGDELRVTIDENASIVRTERR